MTSDDTHARTQKLLEEHRYFGMDKDQVTLIKQVRRASSLLQIVRHSAPSDDLRCPQTCYGLLGRFWLNTLSYDETGPDETGR